MARSFAPQECMQMQACSGCLKRPLDRLGRLRPRTQQRGSPTATHRNVTAPYVCLGGGMHVCNSLHASFSPLGLDILLTVCQCYCSKRASVCGAVPCRPRLLAYLAGFPDGCLVACRVMRALGIQHLSKRMPCPNIPQAGCAMCWLCLLLSG